MSKKNKELVIKDLHVGVEGTPILKGVTLTVKKGETAALMGPNGSGKSTLAYAIMGHPKYEVTSGEVWFKGENVLELKPDERARLGLFLSFQYPQNISGVTLGNFLRTALNARRPKDDPIPVGKFAKFLKEEMAKLKIELAFSRRYVNEGFSGGEKKRAEILQMAILRPEIGILDETDSGLDIDAMKVVAKGVNSLLGPDLGILIITHYQRILNYIKPDVVHVMIDGKIAKSGGVELVHKLEDQGYDWLIKKAKVSA